MANEGNQTVKDQKPRKIDSSILSRWEVNLLRWLAGAAVAAVIGLAIVWIVSAWRADGLVIEAFNVSSGYPSKDNSLNGETIAKLFTAEMNDIYTVSESEPIAKPVENNWADDIKIEIPESGTTFGELNRDLHLLIGHETHLTGVVYATDKQVSATVSIGTHVCAFMSDGSDGKTLKDLLRTAAECVYQDTQPFLYAAYLANRDGSPADKERDIKEAREKFEEQTKSSDKFQRAWGFVELGLLMVQEYPNSPKAQTQAITLYREAIAIEPRYALAHSDLSDAEGALGHSESAAAEQKTFDTLLERNAAVDLDSGEVERYRYSAAVDLARDIGDYAAAARLYAGAYCKDGAEDCKDAIDNLAGLHDIKHAFDLLDESSATPDTNGEPECSRHPIPNDNAKQSTGYLQRKFFIDIARECWSDAIEEEQYAEADFAYDPAGALDTVMEMYPSEALARTRTGDFPGAHSRIEKTPRDCFDCMITRGDIRVEEWQQAIAEGNKPLAKDMWAAAEYWYAKAAGTGTLLPFAYQAWGEALLKKGKYDAAIEKFRVAYRRSPHFADPLEMWGEALMQKNRSDLALAKFEEANKYAPNWGRLHLKWGEAFFYSGHKDEAKSQFAIAAALDLNAADHAALTRQQAKF
ncbi:MAG: hypothetical protein ABSD21_07675 [Rhizomicrobium sp.]|jgi:tetratricopeptide (TPR) repeat protein